MGNTKSMFDLTDCWGTAIIHMRALGLLNHKSKRIPRSRLPGQGTNLKMANFLTVEDSPQSTVVICRRQKPMAEAEAMVRQRLAAGSFNSSKT